VANELVPLNSRIVYIGLQHFIITIHSLMQVIVCGRDTVKSPLIHTGNN